MNVTGTQKHTNCPGTALNLPQGMNHFEFVIAKFVQCLLTQQLLKSGDLLWESGDDVATSSVAGSVETDSVFTNIYC